MPAAGAALPTSDTISWVGSRARPSLDFPLGCRLPCRSLDPYHASQCQMVLQGPLQHCMRGRQGGEREMASEWVRSGSMVVVRATRVASLPPSPVQGWLAAVWGSWNQPKHLLWKYFGGNTNFAPNKQTGQKGLFKESKKVPTEKKRWLIQMPQNCLGTLYLVTVTFQSNTQVQCNGRLFVIVIKCLEF